MKKDDVRVLRTYNQLVAGMMELLLTKNFDEISVSEICDASGVHRATFYNHFNDKYEFLNFCFKNKLEGISFDNLEKGSSPDIIKRNILHFVYSVLEFIDENRILFTSAFSGKESCTFNSSFASAINNFCYEKLNAVLSAPLNQIAIVASYYSGAFVGIIRWHIFSGRKEDVDHIMTFIEHRADELCGYYEKYLLKED